MALAPQPPLWPSPVSVRRRLQWGFAKRVKKMWKSRGKTCAVIGCTNCDRDLKVWDESPCESHRPHRHKECPCVRPFAMHRFPRNTETRLRWIANLQRKDFVPGTSARVSFSGRNGRLSASVVWCTPICSDTLVLKHASCCVYALHACRRHETVTLALAGRSERRLSHSFLVFVSAYQP